MARNNTKAAQYKTVRILIRGSDIDVVPRCEDLQCGTHEQIEWRVCPPDLDFTVRFDKEAGSPFEGKVFNNQKNISGPLNVELGIDEDDRFYPYTLTVAGQTIDPGVIIWKRH